MTKPATAPQFDDTDLLDPISPDAPTGVSLRFGPVYAAIEESRRADDQTLPQGIWERELKSASWEDVAERCRLALRDKSKDLQLAGWLCEARTHVHGVGATAQGIDLIARLCETYWDGLYPEDDLDADSPRFSPILWLDRTLSTILLTTPLMVGRDEDGPISWSWSDHYNAQRYAAAAQKNSGKKAPKHRHTLEGFAETATTVSLDNLRPVAKALGDIATSRERLEEVLGGLIGDRAPALSQLRRTVTDVRDLLVSLLAQHENPDALELVNKVEELDPSPDDSPEVESPQQEQPVDESGHNEFGTLDQTTASGAERDDVYATLARIAAHLRKTEPHSVTPYLIEKSVAWRDKSLQEIIAEMDADGADPRVLKWLLSA
ncbi:MAG: type VI secretion system protein TssA [Pseudomonadota bacterium]